MQPQRARPLQSAAFPVHSPAGMEVRRPHQATVQLKAVVRTWPAQQQHAQQTEVPPS